MKFTEKELEKLEKKRIDEIDNWRRVATKNFNEAEDYKSRVNKAIEYIEEKYSNEDGTIWHEGFEEILDILKGVDKE